MPPEFLQLLGFLIDKIYQLAAPVNFIRIQLQWKIILCQLSEIFYDLDAIFVEL